MGVGKKPPGVGVSWRYGWCAWTFHTDSKAYMSEEDDMEYLQDEGKEVDGDKEKSQQR